MKTKIWSITAIALAATFILFGTSYAGDRGDRMTFSGRVTSSNQLVDNHGNAYDIANSGEGLEVQSLIGKKVEVKGTVMDKGGQPTIEVHNYKIKPWSSLRPDNR